MTRAASRAEVVAAVSALSRPAVVGVSGYGGAGKSTLSRALESAVPGAVRLRGDDFLDPRRSHQRSSDWDGVDRERMREVIALFRAGEPVRYRPVDWSTWELGEPVDLPAGSVLIVDSIGILHPDLLGHFDLTVWVDASHEDATRRGMARDRAAGSDHDRLWVEVWEPNDRDFDALFSPRDVADLRCGPVPEH